MRRTRRLGMAAAVAAATTLTMSAVLTAGVAIRSFDRHVLLENPEDDSAGVSVGDLNGDGRPDIVFGKGHHRPLLNRVLLNDTKGSFAAANLGDTPDRTYSAALTDIDHDGDLDVIVSNDLPDPKRVYRNAGNGTFTLAGTWGEPSWPTRHVTIADLNGDGHPDIVAANAGARIPLPIPFPSFMCLNDGTGMFPRCRPLPSESAVRIRPADFDGNGTTDLFVPHRDGGRNYVVWNDGTGFVRRTSFRERTAVGAANSFIRVSGVGDFDGDGRLDIVVGDGEAKSASVFLNAGGRSFHEPIALATRNHEAFAIGVGDLNRDGKADVVLGYYNSPGSVFFNSGDGRVFLEEPWDDGKGVVDEIALADMDADGWLDIVVARTGAANGIWYNSPPRPAR